MVPVCALQIVITEASITVNVDELLKLKWTPILIPLIVGILNFNKLDKGLKYLYCYVAYGTINEITYYVLIKTGSTNTIFLQHFYTLASFILLGFFYKEILKKIIPRKIVLLVIFMFIAYAIFNVLFLQSLFEYPSLPGSILRIVYLLASIIFFYKTMVDAKIKKLWEEPLIWINFAILIYYSGGLFFSILFNMILEYSMEFSKLIVRYFAILNALFYILIAIGFYKAGKQKAK